MNYMESCRHSNIMWISNFQVSIYRDVLIKLCIKLLISIKEMLKDLQRQMTRSDI